MATAHAPRSFGHLTELALLLLLATLWGASYTFIKLGVESIPPVTLIAARTTIAAVVLLAVLHWRGVAMPTDLALWRRFLFQACLNSVIPFTLIAWAEQSIDAGLATILNSSAPMFTFVLAWCLAREQSATRRDGAAGRRERPRAIDRGRGGNGRSVAKTIEACAGSPREDLAAR